MFAKLFTGCDAYVTIQRHNDHIRTTYTTRIYIIIQATKRMHIKFLPMANMGGYIAEIHIYFENGQENPQM